MTRYILFPRKRPSAFQKIGEQLSILSSERDELFEETREMRSADEILEPIDRALESSRAFGFDVLASGTRHESYLHYSILEGESGALEALAYHEDAFVITEDVAMESVEPLYGTEVSQTPEIHGAPWHFAATMTDQAAAQGYDGRNTRVAILDSGIEQVPDLRDRINKAYEFNPTMEMMIPSLGGDSNVHGTFMAGLVAGRKTGIAPAAQLLDVQVTPYGKRPCFSRYVAAIDLILSTEYCQVINISAGFSEFRDAMMIPFVEAWEAGVLTVAAIGNSSGTSLSPGNFPNVLGIGAATQNNIAYSKNGGGVLHYGDKEYIKPDFLAPGVNVTSCAIDGSYYDHSGTSMATAVTSGLAAVYASAFPNLRANQLRGVLLTSCVDIGLSKYEQGHGLVTALKLWSGAAIS